MLRLEMLPAGCGDCLWLECGAPGQTHIAIIDGGITDTAKCLEKRMKQALAERGGTRLSIDLLVVTHIDTDHIDGVLAMLKEGNVDVEFRDIWFNGTRQLSNLLGPEEGDELSEILSGQGLPWNEEFNGKTVEIPEDTKEDLLKGHFGDLTLTVLGPAHKRVTKLADVWQSVMGEFERGAGRRAERPDLLGRKDTWPPVFKDKETSDTKPANGSSIVLLAEYEEHGQKCALLLPGDAFPGDIRRAITRLQKERGLGHQRLALNAFKLPHHGSCRNLNRSLLESLDCDSYLVSTDGSGYSHPDHQALLRVILFGGSDPCLMFNYDAETTRDWRDEAADLQGTVPSYRTLFPVCPGESLVLEWPW